MNLHDSWRNFLYKNLVLILLLFTCIEVGYNFYRCENSTRICYKYQDINSKQFVVKCIKKISFKHLEGDVKEGRSFKSNVGSIPTVFSSWKENK